MPQATDELRAKMKDYFGDEIDDGGPSMYLTEQGFKLEKGFYWTAPDRLKKWDEMSEKEVDCVCFLCDEWDYGPVIWRRETPFI